MTVKANPASIMPLALTNTQVSSASVHLDSLANSVRKVGAKSSCSVVIVPLCPDWNSQKFTFDLHNYILQR